jgi:hypothetical protein
MPKINTKKKIELNFPSFLKRGDDDDDEVLPDSAALAVGVVRSEGVLLPHAVLLLVASRCFALRGDDDGPRRQKQHRRFHTVVRVNTIQPINDNILSS